MQATEVRELNDQELQDRIAELTEERFRLRLRAATQALEQPHRLRELRQDIARMKTILTERRTGSKETEGSKGSPATTAPRASKAKRTSARRGR